MAGEGGIPGPGPGPGNQPLEESPPPLQDGAVGGAGHVRPGGGTGSLQEPRAQDETQRNETDGDQRMELGPFGLLFDDEDILAERIRSMEQGTGARKKD